MTDNGSDLDSEAPLIAKLGDDGLPEMDEDTREESSSKMCKMMPAFMLVPRLFGAGVAYLIYTYGSTASYDARIAYFTTVSPSTVGDPNYGFLFLGVFIFSLMVNWVNSWPMIAKAAVMPGNAGNVRANMQIFKVNYPEKFGTSLPYVVLEEEGYVGEYNRANRSLTHFVENVPCFLLNLVFAGFVFPFPTMVCIVIYSIGRMAHQIGYSMKGYGGHGLGFALAMFANVVLEMLVLGAAIKSLTLPAV